MKPYKFNVVFTNHNVETVYTFNQYAAKILAQAEQIKKGNSYNVEFVLQYLDNGEERIYK